MKLEEMPKTELRELESIIDYLLTDYPDIKLTELQDKILEILGE